VLGRPGAGLPHPDADLGEGFGSRGVPRGDGAAGYRQRELYQGVASAERVAALRPGGWRNVPGTGQAEGCCGWEGDSQSSDDDRPDEENRAPDDRPYLDVSRLRLLERPVLSVQCLPCQL
jgi:hypothetical protein